MLPQAGLLVTACWIVWAVVWAAGWLYNAVRGPRTRRAESQWPFWVLVALAWWAFAHERGAAHPAMLGHGMWTAGAGAGIVVAGTLFTLWARVVLGRMWSGAPSVKEGHVLQTSGPYAVTRHPIYTGMLAMGLGTVLVSGRAWEGVLFGVFLVYVLFKIRTEERLMRETFGPQYMDYRRRVPQLVPGLRGTRVR